MLVHQSLKPKFVRSLLAEFGATQLVLSGLAGIDNAQLSLFMNGHRGLSTLSQREIYRVFQFFEDLRGDVELPLDFSDITVLRPLWKKWCEARTEGEVVRTQAEGS